MVPPLVLGAALSAAISVGRAPGAEDCPDAERLTARVDRIAEASAHTSSDAARTTVHVDFSRSGDSYQATLHLTGAREGERALRDEGPTCDALADAVAVTTALLFDASETRPKVDVEAHDESKRARAPTFTWWISGHFGAGAGLVGGPTWLTGAAIEASALGIGSLELGGTWTGSRTNDLGAGAVRARLGYLELGVFRSLTGETIRVGPCFLFAGGELRGAGEGYPITSSAALMWWAVGAGVRGEVGLGAGLRLRLRALALVPTRKESFSVGYVGKPYESSPAGGLAEVGLSVKVW
jgi:hypothetical protein